MWRGVVTRAEKGSALGAEHDERVDPGRVAVLSGAVQVQLAVQIQLAYTVHLSDWFVQGIGQGIWNSGRGSGTRAGDPAASRLLISFTPPSRMAHKSHTFSTSPLRTCVRVMNVSWTWHVSRKPPLSVAHPPTL